MHSWRFLMCLGKSLKSGKESRLSVRLEQLEDSGRFGGGICLPIGCLPTCLKKHSKNMARSVMIPDMTHCDLCAQGSFENRRWGWKALSTIGCKSAGLRDFENFSTKWHKMVSCDIYKNTVHHRLVNTLRQYFFQEAWWKHGETYGTYPGDWDALCTNPRLHTVL